MRTNSSDRPTALISQHLRRSGITQIALAEELGVSQSQISRVLSGKSSKRSKLLAKICNYAFKPPPAAAAEAVRQNEELIKALAETWDGTQEHAQALATVIRSLGGLSSPAQRRRPRDAS